MTFYRKKPWHCFEIGVTFYKRRPYIVHLGRWEWKAGPPPEPGNSVFGILFGEEPSEKFKKQLPLVRRLIESTEEFVNVGTQSQGGGT